MMIEHPLKAGSAFPKNLARTTDPQLAHERQSKRLKVLREVIAVFTMFGCSLARAPRTASAITSSEKSAVLAPGFDRIHANDASAPTHRSDRARKFWSW